MRAPVRSLGGAASLMKSRWYPTATTLAGTSRSRATRRKRKIQSAQSARHSKRVHNGGRRERHGMFPLLKRRRGEPFPGEQRPKLAMQSGAGVKRDKREPPRPSKQAGTGRYRNRGRRGHSYYRGRRRGRIANDGHQHLIYDGSRWQGGQASVGSHLCVASNQDQLPHSDGCVSRHRGGGRQLRLSRVRAFG